MINYTRPPKRMPARPRSGQTDVVCAPLEPVIQPPLPSVFTVQQGRPGPPGPMGPMGPVGPQGPPAIGEGFVYTDHTLTGVGSNVDPLSNPGVDGGIY